VTKALEVRVSVSVQCLLAQLEVTQIFFISTSGGCVARANHSIWCIRHAQSTDAEVMSLYVHCLLVHALYSALHMCKTLTGSVAGSAFGVSQCCVQHAMICPS